MFQAIKSAFQELNSRKLAVLIIIDKHSTEFSTTVVPSISRTSLSAANTTNHQSRNRNRDWSKKIAAVQVPITAHDAITNGTHIKNFS
jgi:hypothetical protein